MYFFLHPLNWTFFDYSIDLDFLHGNMEEEHIQNLFEDLKVMTNSFK